MNHASLFSGRCAGFDLAAGMLGWHNVFHCEKDKSRREIIKQHWPNAISYGDITATDFSIHRGQIDVLSGSDPCQPHSVAGLGKGTKDVRFLWPEMLRSVREIHPAWVINENVDGTIANGVLDIKMSDLESEGYACQAYCIPAEAVGALHQRERVWLVAHNANINRGCKESGSVRGSQKKEQALEGQQYEAYKSWGSVNLWPDNPDANSQRCKEQYSAAIAGRKQEGHAGYFGFGAYPHGNITRDVLESGIVGMLNGLPEGMDYTQRNKRIAACGDAIVWQIAYEIFKAITESLKESLSSSGILNLSRTRDLGGKISFTGV